MFPRTPKAIRQEIAQAKICADEAFATGLRVGNDGAVIGGRTPCATVLFACYPFPSNWPGPARIGPFFSGTAALLRRVVAICVNDSFFQFALPLVAIESAHRTTNKRGSSKCGKLLSSSLFLARRSLAAWAQAPRQNVPVPALSAARRLAPSRTTGLLNLRLWAASLVLSLANKVCAADHALARSLITSVAGRGVPLTGLFYVYAPARASGGKEPCSRRS